MPRPPLRLAAQAKGLQLTQSCVSYRQVKSLRYSSLRQLADAVAASRTKIRQLCRISRATQLDRDDAPVEEFPVSQAEFLKENDNAQGYTC